MGKPIVMLVDDQAGDRETVERELRKRYSADYEIVSLPSAPDALQQLAALQTAQAQVAIILADLWMPEMTGIEFLDRANRYHPHAKRVLLIRWIDSSAAEPILQATTLGWIDTYVAKPLSAPDEQFHRLLTGLLADWSRQHRPGANVVQIVGEQWSARSHEARDLLDRYGIPFGFYAVHSEDGQTLLRKVQRPDGPFPVFILLDGRVLTAPSNEEVAQALGAQAAVEGGTYDLAIIGAGPAGLSAAVNGASEGLRTIVVEREAIGGQAGASSLIRNYLGFPHGISGAELASRAYRQAWLFGAEFYLLRHATGLHAGEQEHRLLLSDGSEITSRSIVLAMGAAYRRLGIPHIEALLGAGVFYGGTVSEARAMTGQPVFVAGAGNSAGQAAVHLAQYAEHVTILARGASLAASMSDYLVKEIEATHNISVRLHTHIVDGWGERRLEGLVLEGSASASVESVPAAALFVLIGAQPHTDWLPPAIQRDRHGFILTGPDLVSQGKLPDNWPSHRAPFLLETSLPGVFAIGDVRHRSVKRVASAVGEGGIAIPQVHEYLSAAVAAARGSSSGG